MAKQVCNSEIMNIDASYCIECPIKSAQDYHCHMCNQEFQSDEKYSMSEKMSTVLFCNECILKDFENIITIRTGIISCNNVSLK